MNITPNAIPVLLLAIFVGWINSQRHLIAKLEQESAILERSLAANSTDFGQEISSSLTNPSAPSITGKHPLDLRNIANDMLEIRRALNTGDVRPSERFEQKVQSMSKEELTSALDEMVFLQLPSDIRRWLEITLFRSLSLLDPEFTLTRYIDRNTMLMVCSEALKKWAIKDEKSAITWFDQQIAAGKFESKSLDGKSRPRQRLESQLIEYLLSTDPAAAASRLAFFPADQRADVLVAPEKKEAQLAFAGLVRSQLPMAEQGDKLALQATLYAYSDGYTSISDYLDRIVASPAERAVCVAAAAETKVQFLSRNRRIGREDIDELREWVSTQAPSTVDKVTGKVLAQSLLGDKKLGFNEAAAFASQYHAVSGNDEVLTEFLSNFNGDDHAEDARNLATKITDPKRREEILERLK